MYASVCTCLHLSAPVCKCRERLPHPEPATPIRYSGQYSLQVVEDSVFIMDSNCDGIFEPNEQMSVTFQVRNTGQMPTPRFQNIEVELKSNEHVHFERKIHSITVGGSLQPGEVRACPGALWPRCNNL